MMRRIKQELEPSSGHSSKNQVANFDATPFCYEGGKKRNKVTPGECMRFYKKIRRWEEKK
jgi:hypothetical protein